MSDRKQTKELLMRAALLFPIAPDLLELLHS